MTRRSLQHSALIGFALLAAATPTYPCDIPVFRYAQERWPLTPYELYCNPESTELTQAIQQHNANLQPAPAPPEPADAPPGLHLIRPYANGNRELIWSGDPSTTSLQSILNSPARTRILEYLADDFVAVWIFLDPETTQDDAGFQLLENNLRAMESTLQWHREYLDLLKKNRLLAPPPDIRFAAVRISRSDPNEQVLIRQLLTSEWDLAEAKGAIAFPVYGRGRVLYALVGPGISGRNIAEACAFLVGPCACTIKDDNPGVDLLLDFDWDDHISELLMTAEEIAPPAGFANLGDTLAWGPPTDAESEPVPVAPPLTNEADASTDAAPAHSTIQRSALLTMTVALLVVLTASVWLLLRKR